ncbi:MAG TPA: hypothetical protein VE078_18585 [Thermoanaerobaculia bacterium]|nr:hypothetical protein [Thermoanaerobaculia bacterium]
MRSRRIAVAFLLIFVLATSGAWAAGDRPEYRGGFLQQLWSWISIIWTPPPPTTDSGCIIDPLGCPEDQ